MNKKARSRKFTTKQSARLGAYFAAGVGASMAVSSDADAAIVFFDVNPDQTFSLDGTLNFGNIDLGTGTYSLNSTAGTNFGLTFPGSYGGLVGYLNPLGNIEWGFSGSYVERLSLNDSISGASAWSWGSTPAAFLLGGYGAYDGNWGFSGPNETKTGFAPLRFDTGGGNYYYGWAEITAQAGNIFSPPYVGTVTVTVSGFAFESDLNAAILAGDQGGGPGPEPIPEPGTWAAAALLLGGATYLGWRRRRDAAQKEAA